MGQRYKSEILWVTIKRTNLYKKLRHSIPWERFPYLYVQIYKNILYIQKNVLSNKDYFLLIYTFICIIIFRRRIQVSKVTKCAFLARVWEWREIGVDCPVIYILFCMLLFTRLEKVQYPGSRDAKGFF